METHNTDINPTSNPRTQLDTARLIQPDREYWLGFGLYLGPEWQALPADGWLTFAEVYGPPYGGTSPFRLGMHGPDIALHRNWTYRNDRPWTTPLVREKWLDFAFHFKLSTDPAVGFYEVRLNSGTGWRSLLLNGQERLHFATIDATNAGGANGSHLKNYRRADMWLDPKTCYFAGHRIGESLAAVDPRSYVGS